MQIHETSITTFKNYLNLKLTFNCALFQEYEVKLPETEPIKIVVADISVWMHDRVEGECHSQKNRMIVERIYDLRRWIYKLAVNKKMREIEYGNNNNKFFVLLPFDALTWSHQNHVYGAHASQIQKITMISNISQLSMYSIKKCYKSQLADYHTFNIIFQTIEQNCLGWNTIKSRPYLKLSQNWKSVDYQEGHCYWTSVKEDPYSNDLHKLQQALESITHSKLQQIEQDQRQFNEAKLLTLKDLFAILYQKSYNDFYRHYTSVFKTTFVLTDNQQFSRNLKYFYHLRNDHHNLKLVLNQQRGQYQSQVMLNAESIQKIHSSFIEEKIIESQYPNFVQKEYYSIGKKQSLQSILNLMKKQTKQERVRYHFLKSKIQWKFGNFYRSLAHLHQARRQTNDPHLLYIIKFQQARNWELLGQVDKAQADYKQSIAYAQQIIPSCYPFLLANLKILYWKRGKIEQANTVQQKIKEFKRVSNIHKLIKIPQLGCVKITESILQIFSSAFKNDKQEKSLSKAQFMKLQTERAPFLIPIWTHLKSFFDKNKPQKATNLLHVPQQNIYLGQVKWAMHFVILLHHIQNRTQSQLIQTTIEDIFQHLDVLKKSNLKNYHRFLFLLSFYLQKQQAKTAIHSIETIISDKNIIYSKVVRLSLVKRLAQLYNQQNMLQKLLQLYRTQNVIQSGDIQCLFDFIQVSAQLQHYSAVVTIGIVYLNSIKQYQTQSSVSKAKETGRLLNRSYEVRLLMLASYSKLRCYDGLTETIEHLQNDLNEKTKDIRAFLIELGSVCYQTYQAGQFQLSYNLIQKLIHYDCIRQEQKDSNIKSYSGMSLFYLANIETIHRAYEQILVKTNIEAKSIEIEWFRAKSISIDNQITRNSGCQDEAILPVATQKILLKDILDLLNSQLKQRQCNFVHIFQHFQILLKYQKDLQQLFEQLVAQIVNINKTQGKKSLKANIMHILFLIISVKQDGIATQMYLLYWLSFFKTNFTPTEQLNDYWLSKQNRDIRLDKLLFDYFEDRVQIADSLRLQKLCWFQTKQQELLILKDQYKQIVSSELGFQDQKLQLKILNFSIKYKTNFNSSLDESNTLIKMEQILAQLDCPDHNL